MKMVFPILKNKYFISTLVVILYILILHETDIFSLQNKKTKVTELEQQIELKKQDIQELKIALNELEDPRSLEKYAREYHYFKKEDEDIFIFSFE
ncbi:MAG: septum formation initiator family protein [Crocinitomicaceae bacterium]|nr:septum formation initiator family protein [Crocinitomicaceae bacterium]